MKHAKHVVTAIFLLLSSTSHANLLFSEYIEGSSYNKALEIYNTGELIDFSSNDYAIDIYTNGTTEARYSIDLTGVLASNDTFVISHSRANADLTSVANILTGNLSFNGDDAITLTHNGAIIDRIGQIGVDPGTQWANGATATADMTLRRLTTLVAGDSDPFTEFNPADQWEAFSLDDFSGLGSHTLTEPLPFQAIEQDVAVPLPASSVLMLMGLLPLLLSASRRHSAVAANA